MTSQFLYNQAILVSVLINLFSGSINNILCIILCVIDYFVPSNLQTFTPYFLSINSSTLSIFITQIKEANLNPIRIWIITSWKPYKVWERNISGINNKVKVNTKCILKDRFLLFVEYIINVILCNIKSYLNERQLYSG